MKLSLKLLYSNIVLQLLDGVSTYIGVERLGLMEKNPIICNMYSLFWAKYASIVIMFLYYKAYGDSKHYKLYMIIMLIVAVFVVCGNFWAIF